jgi:hypothetical protein
VQSNEADIDNDVDVDANTGDNSAEDNTGGSVEISTGDTDTKVEVSNTVNSNSAQVDCCTSNDTTVEISGNGTGSENTAGVTQTNTTGVWQDNDADVDNDVDVDSETGDNDAEDNTGGDVSVETGDADVTVKLSTTANMNTAVVGGGSSDPSSLDVLVTGNGSDSVNDVALALVKDITVVQENDADVDNDVDVDSSTGDNDVEDNTGGETGIDTGDATTDVTVDNLVNFNGADVDCGCALDAEVKIGSNGTDSTNEIVATLADTQNVFQGGEDEAGNDADLDNDVDVDAETGDNEVEDSTTQPDGDPMIETGDADATLTYTNSGNVNVFGNASDFPEVDFDFHFSLDWETLLGLLGLEL